jgi:hypothetical protein
MIVLSSSISLTEPRFTVEENPVFVLLKPISIRGTGVLGRIIKNNALKGTETTEIKMATLKRFINFSKFIKSSLTSFMYVRSKMAKIVKTSIRRTLMRNIHEILKSEELPSKSRERR